MVAMCNDGVIFNNSCYCPRFKCGETCEMHCYGEIALLLNSIVAWMLQSALNFQRETQT